jgi:hypothetical protein
MSRKTSRVRKFFSYYRPYLGLFSADMACAVIVYDLECQPPVNVFSAVALLTFKNNLISKIELFYDARPFNIKK